MRLVCGRKRKPRSSSRESSIFRSVPLHGSTLTVTSLFFWPSFAPNRISYIFDPRRRRRLHPDLLTVINDRSSPQGEVKSGHQLRDLTVVLAVSITIV